jgi:hypothetical protein
MNYVNPPFKKSFLVAFLERAVLEQKQNKTTLFLCPVTTWSGPVWDIIHENASLILVLSQPLTFMKEDGTEYEKPLPVKLWVVLFASSTYIPKRYYSNWQKIQIGNVFEAVVLKP